MKNRNTLRAVGVMAAVVAFSFGGSVMGDNFFKQVVHTDAFEMMGQKTPEKNDTTRMWLTEGKACSATGDTAAVIFYLEKGEICFISHKKKQYSLMPMDLGEIIDEALEEEDDEEARQMAEVMKGMAGAIMGSAEITVTPTEETRKIGDWDTRKYTVNMSMAMMNMETEIWSTDDIKCDPALYHAVTSGMMAMMPGMSNIVNEMMKIEGTPVLSVSTVNMMGTPVKTEVRLLEYSEKSAPEGIFEVPEGYTKVDLTHGGL